MSKEEEIISAFITKLKTITTADGFETDIGTNVNDFNDKTIAADVPVYVELRDAQTNFLQKGDPGFLENAHKQQMIIEIYVQFSKKNIAYARKAVSDIYKMIGINKWQFWDNNKIWIFPLRHQKTVNQEDREISAVKIFLIVEFVTKEWGIDEPV